VKLRSIVILPLASVLVLFAGIAQSSHESSNDHKVGDAIHSLRHPPLTSSALATVVIKPSKPVYRLGESITASVSLVAGDRGVYVSRHLGAATGNWPGFSIWLETLDGQSAQTCGHGGAADFGGPLPPPSEVLKKEFIFLKPGEERQLDMGIDCPPVKRGAYRIQAAYSPDYPQTDKVAELPETHGLVLRERIQGELVIEIH
jgi:hypothetical protein